MIDSTKMNQGIEGSKNIQNDFIYDESSDGYNQVKTMLVEKLGYVASQVVATIMKDPHTASDKLEEYAIIMQKKMPVIISQGKDQIDAQMTKDGKPNEYVKIDATTEVLGKEVGTSLLDGCVKVVDQVSQKAETSEETQLNTSLGL